MLLLYLIAAATAVIYKKFIAQIIFFTLGDWRKIVRMVEPGELTPLKKHGKCTSKDWLNIEIGQMRSLEEVGQTVNISIEIENVPELKAKIRLMGEAELQEVFSATFGKKASVMFRLST